MFTGAEGGVYRPAAAADLLLQLLLMCELGANWEPNERTVPLKPRGSRRKEPYGGNRNTRLADHTRLVVSVHNHSNRQNQDVYPHTGRKYVYYIYVQSLWTSELQRSTWRQRWYEAMEVLLLHLSLPPSFLFCWSLFSYYSVMSLLSLRPSASHSHFSSFVSRSFSEVFTLRHFLSLFLDIFLYFLYIALV